MSTAPASILPPLPPTTTETPVDHDSLPARQARTAARVAEREMAIRRAQWHALGNLYTDVWGTVPKRKGADGNLLPPDQSLRRNEDNLSPADAWAALGTMAGPDLAAFQVELTASAQIDPTTARHPDTDEDMTGAPEGWSLAPQPDGTVTASYAAPAAA